MKSKYNKYVLVSTSLVAIILMAGVFSAYPDKTAPIGADKVLIYNSESTKTNTSTLSNLTKGLAAASTTESGILTTGTQTLAGEKTFSSQLFVTRGSFADAFPSNKMLNLTGTYTGTGTPRGISTELTITPSGASPGAGYVNIINGTVNATSGIYYGIYSSINSSATSGALSGVIGSRAIASQGNTAGTSTELWGGGFTATQNSTSTTTENAIGVKGIVTGNGAKTNAFGFKAELAGANTTNSYGIYLDANTGSPTHDWGVYSLAAKNHFSGNVNIGGVLTVSLTTPASATAPGVAGTITADENFIYVCTATDTWKRVAISTW